MKKIYAITLFLNITFLGHTQLDTSFQQTTIEHGSLESQQLVDAKKHYLTLQKDEKYLLKFGFAGTILPSEHPIHLFPSFSFSNSLFLSYEYRLKNGFSVNTMLDYNRATFSTISQTYNDFLSSFIIHRYGVAIEPRWYLRKRQNIEKGVIGNNLNGLYLSMKAGIKYWQKPFGARSDGKRSYFKGLYQYGTLNIGWQRRFGQHGFIHFQLGTGVQRNPQDIIELGTPNNSYKITPLPKWRMISNYRVGLGLAIGSKGDKTIRQNIWTYHQADRDIWKIDLFGLLLGLENTAFNSRINIGYERGSRNASFSMTTNIVYLGSSNRWDNELSLQIAPRYYYNLKKRIRQGKTANNLSADYFSFRNQWNFNITGEDGYHYFENKYDLSFLWGMQRRVFENMFINYELGYDFPSANQWDGEIISELKIGLAF